MEAGGRRKLRSANDTDAHDRRGLPSTQRANVPLAPLAGLAVAVAGLAGCLDFPPGLIATDLGRPDLARADGSVGEGDAKHQEAGAARDTGRDTTSPRDTASPDKGRPPDSGPSCKSWKDGWSCSSGGGTCASRTISCKKVDLNLNWSCSCTVGSGGATSCGKFSVLASLQDACKAAEHAFENLSCCTP